MNSKKNYNNIDGDNSCSIKKSHPIDSEKNGGIDRSSKNEQETSPIQKQTDLENILINFFRYFK